jgi:cytochrome c-type biogenesis protein CcmH
MRLASLLVTLGFLLSLSAPAFAVDPQELLKDPALEARARDISAGLRCLVCQNQSIDDSDAPLARDLRILVREQLKKGDTNEQVIDYLVARYGEFVLLKPRFNLNTALLWLAPVLLIGGGAALALRVVRRSKEDAPAAQPLTEEEQAELQAVLSEEKRGGR